MSERAGWRALFGAWVGNDIDERLEETMGDDQCIVGNLDCGVYNICDVCARAIGEEESEEFEKDKLCLCSFFYAKKHVKTYPRNVGKSVR
jgi:hypothetical protein